jgi:beta-carotene 3-hydroxylase
MAINYLVDIPITFLGFFGMEFIARLMHKYLMHGLLWSLHKDHHIDMGRKFQRNNLFGLFFAFIAIILFIATLRTGDTAFAAAGFGMAIYGLVYLIVHDMIIHNSYIHLRDRKHSRYVQNLIAVHQMHHTNDGRDHGKNWGFLFYIPGIDIPPQKGQGKHI